MLLISILLHCHPLTFPSSYISVLKHCRSSTLPSCYTAIQLHSLPVTLPSSTLPSCYTAIQLRSHPDTLPSATLPSWYSAISYTPTLIHCDQLHSHPDTVPSSTLPPWYTAISYTLHSPSYTAFQLNSHPVALLLSYTPILWHYLFAHYTRQGEAPWSRWLGGQCFWEQHTDPNTACCQHRCPDLHTKPKSGTKMLAYHYKLNKETHMFMSIFSFPLGVRACVRACVCMRVCVFACFFNWVVELLIY